MLHYGTQLKSTFIAALAVLMMLTSTAMAMSQVRAAAVGEMVLCTGHGPRIVQIDADGQPVEPRVTCPDCLLDAGALAAIAPAISTPETFDLVDLGVREFASKTPHIRASAYITRAPPSL